jgi:hypothetical protein
MVLAKGSSRSKMLMSVTERQNNIALCIHRRRQNTEHRRIRAIGKTTAENPKSNLATEHTKDTEKESIIDNQLVGAERGSRSWFEAVHADTFDYPFQKRNPQKSVSSLEG